MLDQNNVQYDVKPKHATCNRNYSSQVAREEAGRTVVARNLLLPSRQYSRVASGNVLTDDIAKKNWEQGNEKQKRGSTVYGAQGNCVRIL